MLDPLMLADRLVIVVEGAPPIAAVGAWRARELGAVGSRAVRSGLAGAMWLDVGVELRGVARAMVARETATEEARPAAGEPAAVADVAMLDARALAAMPGVGPAPVAPGRETTGRVCAFVAAC